MASIMNRVTVTRAPKGEKGDPGQDGVAITVTPPDIVHREGETKIYKVYVDMRKGEALVPYGTGEGQFACTPLTQNGTGTLVGDISWGFNIEDGRFYYRIVVLATASGINMTVPFKVNCNGISYPMSFSIVTVANGEQGKQGPLPRGPRVWADIPDGEILYDGTTAEGIRDIVLHAGETWLCVATHKKGAAHEPSITSTDWTRFQFLGLVASDLILSKDAVIDNGIIRNLRTDISGKRVEILHDANDIKIYNESGAESARLSGDILQHSQIFQSGGGDANPMAVGNFAVPLYVAKQTNDTTEGWGGTTSATVNAPEGTLKGKLRVKIDVEDNYTDVGASSDTGGVINIHRKPEITLTVWLNDTPIWRRRGPYNETEIEFSYPVNGSPISILFEVVCSKGTRGTGTWTARPYAAISGMTVVNAESMSRVFGNGMAVSTDTANYFEVIADPNRVMAIKGRSGAAGICCYKDNLYLRFAAGGWHRLSKVTQGTSVLLALTPCTEPIIDTTT